MTSTTTTSGAMQLGLADGGIETALTDRLGQRLPEFAAFTLLDNQGPNPVSGIFEGLPDGARLLVDDRLFSIAYCGGDGNDIVHGGAGDDHVGGGQGIADPNTDPGADSVYGRRWCRGDRDGQVS